jgi:hypothetical protein
LKTIIPALMIAHNVQSSRAALLRDTLQSSELLVKEISHVLTCYGDHLDELANSVETVAFRAQVRGWHCRLPCPCDV